MSLFHRLFGAREKKENPAYRAILSTIGRGQAIWTPRDYANLSKAGYQNCATVFACVSKIAKSASRIDWTLGKKKKGGGEDEHETSPLLKLLAKPNEYEGGSRLTEKILSYLLLAGNSYVLGVRGVQSRPPVYLYSLRPDRMKIIAGDWKAPVSRYEYSIGIAPEKFEARDVLHLMEFHPTNDFYGLSRLEVAARAIDISNKSMEWNKQLLDNDMRPAGIITLDPPLSDEQFDNWVTKFTEKYTGHDTAGGPVIFNGGVEWQSTGMNPKDIDWSTGQKEIMRSICTVFDVPSQLLGDTENTTYSNMQEARKALYMEAILPLMDLYRDELNAWLVPYFGDGLRLDYDRDGIEALQEERAQKYVYLQASDWLTINEKREATGYDAVGEEGDVILVGLGKIPLEEAVAEPEPTPDALKPFAGGTPDKEPKPDEKPDDEDEGDAGKVGKKSAPVPKAKSYWAHLERKERLWLSFEQRVKSREKSFEQIAKGYLQRQAETIRQRAAAASSVGVLKPEDLLNVKDEAKKYVKAFWPWYRDHFIRAGNAGVRATKGELFDDAEFKADDPTSWVFEMTPELEAELRDMVFNSGTKVNQTAIEKIYSVLKDANATNMTVSEFARDIYEKCGTLERWRAMLWARTESAKVDNFGQLEGFKETEFVERKGWMCAMTETSRDEHIEADGQEVGIDEDFTVGGQRMAYPGDPQGKPGNVCNCLPASTLIDSPAPIFAGTLRRYSGEMVEIITRNGHRLSGTPNHPILTNEGWVSLGRLVKGQNVISRGLGKKLGLIDPDVNDHPATIDKIFDSVSTVGRAKTIKDSDVNFHGDGGNGYIDVVSANGLLKGGPEAALAEHLPENHFAGADLSKGFLPGNGSLAKLLFGDRLHPAGDVGGQGHSLPGLWAEMAEPNADRLAHRAGYDAASIEEFLDGTTADPVLIGQLLDSSLAGFVTVDEIVSVHKFDFSGHVYNLQNKVGWYIANNIIAHNCLCDLYPIVGAGE